MNRADIQELHYIAHSGNLPSILEVGLLSHNRAQRIQHFTIAMPEVQQRRARRRLPNGRMLHDHVNLYFNPRNPMMYLRREMHQDLYVLRIHPSILETPRSMIADGNAAADFTRFDSPEVGIARLDSDYVFAEWWIDPDPAVHEEKKRRICAEALVPDQVEAKYIIGAYASCRASLDSLLLTHEGLPATILARMFFL